MSKSDLPDISMSALLKQLKAAKTHPYTITMPLGRYPDDTDFTKLIPDKALRFPAGCVFGDHVKFGSVSFGEHPWVDDEYSETNLRIGDCCVFRGDVSLPENSELGSFAVIQGTLRVGSNSKLGDGVDVHQSAWLKSSVTVKSSFKVNGRLDAAAGCKFGRGLKFGANSKFAHGTELRLGDGNVYKLQDSNGAARSYLVLMGAGSCGRATYFYDTSKGIMIESGCFTGTIKQFRAKVKQDCRKHNSVKRLQYLGMANIACATWGYLDLIE